ncbi:MAG: TFIIB-type zinc ribbon-containing protein, partial [Halobacteria archaeon]|nr:TFIIB-type zinc ribbon-containing protein [Halobacteria archaeon]
MSNSTRQKSKEETRETESEGTKQAEKENCPECGSSEFMSDSERGEVICADCGLVIEEDQVDPGPEWRAFDHKESQKKSRVGAPTTKTMHDKGLTTTIDWKNKDAYGRSISSEKRSQMHRLRKWQERIRTKDASERNL